jgi:hypothetical protein
VQRYFGDFPTDEQVVARESAAAYKSAQCKTSFVSPLLLRNVFNFFFKHRNQQSFKGCKGFVSPLLLRKRF